MIKRPLFAVAIAFAVGIGLSGVLEVPAVVAVCGMLFGCLVALSRRASTLAVLFIVTAVGMIRFEIHSVIATDDVSRFARSGVSAVHGRVISDVDLREDRAMFPLAVNAVRTQNRWVRASGRLMVTYYRQDDPTWRAPAYGDVLIIGSRISIPRDAGRLESFSWKDYLARKGIHAVAYVRSPKQVRLQRNDPPNPVQALAIRARDAVAASINSRLPEEEAAVVIGMDLGTYTVLPDRLLTNFTRTGTLHLLAASGFNCAVIVVLCGFLFVRLLRAPRRITTILMILALVFYMMIVGAKPSIIRATIMATLLLLGGLLNRPADAINLLFGAALIILMINPADIFDVGFQLSFAAVLGIVLVIPLIEQITKKWGYNPSAKTSPGWTHRLIDAARRDAWQGLTATIAATLGTLPLSAHYFNQLSLVSIAVNAIVAAAVLPIFAIGFLLPIFADVPLLGDLLAALGTLITGFALTSINWFGELPYSCLYVASPGAAGVAGYYVLLALGLKYAYSRLSAKP